MATPSEIGDLAQDQLPTWKPEPPVPGLNELATSNRLHKHAQKFLEHPNTGELLDRYSMCLQASQPEMVSRLATHIAMWIALLPASITTSVRGARGLSALLLLAEALYIVEKPYTDWFAGLLALVERRKSELSTAAAGQWSLVSKLLPPLGSAPAIDVQGVPVTPQSHFQGASTARSSWTPPSNSGAQAAIQTPPRPSCRPQGPAYLQTADNESSALFCSSHGAQGFSTDGRTSRHGVWGVSLSGRYPLEGYYGGTCSNAGISFLAGVPVPGTPCPPPSSAPEVTAELEGGGGLPCPQTPPPSRPREVAKVPLKVELTPARRVSVEKTEVPQTHAFAASGQAPEGPEAAAASMQEKSQEHATTPSAAAAAAPAAAQTAALEENARAADSEKTTSAAPAAAEASPTAVSVAPVSPMKAVLSPQSPAPRAEAAAPAAATATATAATSAEAAASAETPPAAPSAAAAASPSSQAQEASQEAPSSKVKKANKKAKKSSGGDDPDDDKAKKKKDKKDKKSKEEDPTLQPQMEAIQSLWEKALVREVKEEPGKVKIKKKPKATAKRSAHRIWFPTKEEPTEERPNRKTTLFAQPVGITATSSQPSREEEEGEEGDDADDDNDDDDEEEEEEVTEEEGGSKSNSQSNSKSSKRASTSTSRSMEKDREDGGEDDAVEPEAESESLPEKKQKDKARDLSPLSRWRAQKASKEDAPSPPKKVGTSKNAAEAADEPEEENQALTESVAECDDKQTQQDTEADKITDANYCDETQDRYQRSEQLWKRQDSFEARSVYIESLWKKFNAGAGDAKVARAVFRATSAALAQPTSLLPTKVRWWSQSPETLPVVNPQDKKEKRLVELQQMRLRNLFVRCCRCFKAGDAKARVTAERVAALIAQTEASGDSRGSPRGQWREVSKQLSVTFGPLLGLNGGETLDEAATTSSTTSTTEDYPAQGGGQSSWGSHARAGQTNGKGKGKGKGKGGGKGKGKGRGKGHSQQSQGSWNQWDSWNSGNSKSSSAWSKTAWQGGLTSAEKRERQRQKRSEQRAFIRRAKLEVGSTSSKDEKTGKADQKAAAAGGGGGGGGGGGAEKEASKKDAAAAAATATKETTATAKTTSDSKPEATTAHSDAIATTKRAKRRRKISKALDQARQLLAKGDVLHPGTTPKPPIRVKKELTEGVDETHLVRSKEESTEGTSKKKHRKEDWEWSEWSEWW